MLDLPPYTLRVSRRARVVRFTVTARQGLVVTLPARFDRSKLPELLRSKQAWLEAALGRVEEERQALAAAESAPLPDRIELPAIGLVWPVEYRAAAGRRLSVEEQEQGALLVAGPIERNACRSALRRWLRQVAQEALPRELSLIAVENGFRFDSVTIRSQRTRWGSCSRRGAISLNDGLLFLLPELLRYVLLHELCHTVHPNHGRDFWLLVAKHEPDYKARVRRLREGWKCVPWWAVA